VRNAWALAASLAHADQATGPGIFFTGEDDWSVLIEQMDSFVEQLDDVGVEGRSTVAPDGDHGFDQRNGALTQSGRQALTGLRWWLADRFPVS
jgi:acetyl esterase/lipase